MLNSSDSTTAGLTTTTITATSNNNNNSTSNNLNNTTIITATTTNATSNSNLNTASAFIGTAATGATTASVAATATASAAGAATTTGTTTTSSAASTTALPTISLYGGPIRLNNIKGYSNRTNNIIYCPPLMQSLNKDESTAVIYFGGDVQDIPENMENNRDTKTYLKWNLENTALILRDAFPRAHIIVVRPMRMEYITFSCFDNFVRGNNAGVPDHTPMHYSLQHLEELLINITKKLTKIMTESELMSILVEAAAIDGTIPQAPTTITDNNTSLSTDSIISLNNSAAGANESSNLSSANPNNVDHSQEMDIDILQVQETVTVDSDGAIIFPCKDDSISIPTDLTSDLLQSEIPTSLTATTNNVPNAKDMLWWRDNLNLDKANLKLVGFSKGCVVLNQFMYEFHYLKTLTPDDSTMMRLVSRIKDMYWLDGGHGGGKNTWITSRCLLETLCRLDINIHVHVTPYQVQDDHRPWIRKEERAFTELLKRMGAPLIRHLHATDSVSSNLFTHFEVLQGFKIQQQHNFVKENSSINNKNDENCSEMNENSK